MIGSPTDKTGAPAAIEERELLRWRSVPAERRMRTTVLVAIVIVGVPLLLAVWYGAFYGLLGILILGGSLLSFFLPTVYVLTDLTVSRRYLGIDQKRKWSEFRSFYPDKNGVLVSPFVRSSRLENFRGMYLRFEGNREQVLAIVTEKVSRPEAGGAA